MANREDARPDLALTSRTLIRRGLPWIPISGEVHYSRLPRAQWTDTLRLMKAGGITVVSTYVFWIHHQEHRDVAPRFDDNLDVAAWGSAELPVGEVFPLYGGYADGFWVDTADGWDDSFRGHFHFSDQWDDPGIGKDLAGVSWSGASGAKHPDFPAATCELGGGMATAYHRRPVVTGADVAALAQVKLGSGTAWQGYYMYAGGTNPRGDTTLQESHATGYPNDLPVRNYDFQAPIGAHLQTRDGFHRLRLQHEFLAAFGARLALMNATIPNRPLDVRDRESLRWSLRSDRRSGFVFINNHQPYEELPARRGVQLEIELADERITLPHRPIDLPAGAFTCWPLRVEVGGVLLNWATVDLLTTVPLEGEEVLVVVKKDGVAAHLCFPGGTSVTGHPSTRTPAGEVLLEDVRGGRDLITVTSATGGTIRLLVLDEPSALRAWTPKFGGVRRLVITEGDVVEDPDGLLIWASQRTSVEVLQAVRKGVDGPSFDRYEVDPELRPVTVTITQTSAGSAPVPPVLAQPGRASAPTRNQIEAHAARFRVTVEGLIPQQRSLLRLDLVGDVAVARVAGHDEDVFWNGTAWDIDITTNGGSTNQDIEVLIYPIDASTPVWLPEPAARLKAGLTGPTARLTSASVIPISPALYQQGGRPP